MKNAGFALGLALACFVAGPLYGDCDDPDNAVENCGFEFGLTPWFFGSADVTVTNLDWRSGAGSAEIDAEFNPVSSTYKFQLGQSGIPVTGGETYELGAFYKRVSGDPLTNRCRVQWAEWDTCPLSGFVASGMTFGFTPNSSSWTETRTVVATDPSTQCIRILVDCLNAPTDFVARVDDVYLIRALFADGFENGDTLAWQ